jgi:hypothetical protein
VLFVHPAAVPVDPQAKALAVMLPTAEIFFNVLSRFGHKMAACAKAEFSTFILQIIIKRAKN